MKNLLARIALPLALTSLLGTGAHAQGREPLHPDFAALGERWAGAMEQLDVPGLAVVVMERDEIVHLETFGVRDVDSRRPVTPDTMFYIASATKPFVAFAARQLAEEGALDLDAPANRYLPRLVLADEQVQRTMTVRNLLCHRPGLRNFPVVFLDAYTGEITEDRYYHFLADVQPTGLVTYSNVHFTLAGRVLESVVGEPWKEVLDRQIFTPLGMTRTTGYADAMYADPDVALPTVWTDGKLVTSGVRKRDTTMHAAGGLGTTIHDLSRWIGVHLNEGESGDRRLLSPEGVEEMLTLQSRDPAGRSRDLDGFGLGWMLGNVYGHRMAQHGGGYVGSAALISFLPDLGLGVAVLANTDQSGSTITQLVTDDVYDHLLAEQRRDPLPGRVARWQSTIAQGSDTGPTGENPARAPDALTLGPSAYVGDYAHPHWGTMRITLEEGRLMGRLGNIRLALLERGRDRFLAFAQGSLEAEGVFHVSGTSVVSLLVNISGYEVIFER